MASSLGTSGTMAVGLGDGYAERTSMATPQHPAGRRLLDGESVDQLTIS